MDAILASMKDKLAKSKAIEEKKYEQQYAEYEKDYQEEKKEKAFQSKIESIVSHNPVHMYDNKISQLPAVESVPAEVLSLAQDKDYRLSRAAITNRYQIVTL